MMMMTHRNSNQNNRNVIHVSRKQLMALKTHTVLFVKCNVNPKLGVLKQHGEREREWPIQES